MCSPFPARSRQTGLAKKLYREIIHSITLPGFFLHIDCQIIRFFSISKAPQVLKLGRELVDRYTKVCEFLAPYR